MHELSLMEAVREQALEQAERHGARCIEVIHLRIGRLAGVEPEALQWAFALVMAGSLAATARLQIETVPARCHCSVCQSSFEAEAGTCRCPRCGTASNRLLQGRELELTSLEIL